MNDENAMDGDPLQAAEVPPARVLVVDDSKLSATKLLKAVARLGHLAEAVLSGPAGLARLREQDFDAVLLDIEMPEMDGLAVLAALKADPALRDIPVIVVSSSFDRIDAVVRAIELGAVDFLPKDFEPAILRARLDSSLAAKRFRDRERDYLRGVETLTRAAQVIEAGAFRPADLDLETVAERRDPLGGLAVVFRGLAHEIYERERRFDRTTRTLRGTLLVIAAGGIFGMAPALGRLAAGMEAPSLGLVVWANLAAALICLAIARLRGEPMGFSRTHLPFFLAWALLLGCLYQISTVAIAAHVTASMIALAGSARGFMVFGLAALVAVERPSLRRLAGLGIGFAAVAAVMAEVGFGGGGDLLWLAAALSLPLMLAVHTLLMTRRPRELGAFATAGAMLGLAALLLAPVAWAMGATIPLADFDVRLALIALALGVSTGVAIALALELVAVAGAVFASQMAYAQTLAGIVWGMILLDERLPPIAWGAFAVVLLGFLLVQPRQAGAEFSITVPIARR